MQVVSYKMNSLIVWLTPNDLCAYFLQLIFTDMAWTTYTNKTYVQVVVFFFSRLLSNMFVPIYAAFSISISQLILGLLFIVAF